VPLSTYLAFSGDCREAFEFYRSVFGGSFTRQMLSAAADKENPRLIKS
jgi:uncharacterized glyoxalase superfamily protein PhnB